MAIYVVTGKLGGGKTLAVVDKINSALAEGRRVATNLDIEARKLPCTDRHTRTTEIIRVPDKPSLEDIELLGYGIKGVTTNQEAKKYYDEGKFGILALDECGTWLNSREWQDKGRAELIKYLLHIRKKLWDVYFIIQDISMLDKQAKKALAEHVVYCRRTDRIKIPLITFLTKLVSSTGVKFPRLHFATVRYGDLPTSVITDRWWYRGDDYFDAYDTTQYFSDDYQDGVYCVLTPWHFYRRSFATKDWRFFMRLTKIYLKQHSVNLVLAAGVMAGSVVTYALTPEPPPPALARATEVQTELTQRAIAKASDLDLYSLKFHSQFDTGHIEFDGLKFVDEDGEVYGQLKLKFLGVRVDKTDSCHWVLTQGDMQHYVSCRQLPGEDI